jgi:Transposase DDE domain group 1
LRPGNVHSADGWRVVLEPVVARYRDTVKRLYFRGDAAFANPEIYEFLEAEGMAYAIRLPANSILQSKIGYLLKRPVGRPPHELRRYFASFSYQAQSWSKPRRVVAKVEWHPGELYPRVGFIVTNLARPAERVVPTSAARRSNGSKRARVRSNGPGCRAVAWPPTPSVFSSMRSLTTSAISCERWRCPR